MNFKSIIPTMIFLTTLTMIPLMMSKKKKSNEKINSPFECGFQIMKSNHSMSMNFFNFTIMFLILEMEIIIFTSMIFSSKSPKMKMTIMTMTTMLFFMMTMEWMSKKIKWSS